MVGHARPSFGESDPTLFAIWRGRGIIENDRQKLLFRINILVVDNVLASLVGYGVGLVESVCGSLLTIVRVCM